jgi:hypothetical protein
MLPRVHFTQLGGSGITRKIEAHDQTLCRNRKSRCERFSTSKDYWSTT